MRRLVGLGALVLASGCVTAPAAKAPSAGEVVQYATGTYDDTTGLRVVLESAPDYGVSGVVLLVAKGAADEEPRQAGLAHLVEHLAFRSRRDERGTLHDALQGLGAGDSNGMTNWDSTTYYALAPSSSTAALVDLFLAVLADPLAGVDEADFRHELAIVRNEMRFRTENGTPGQALSWVANATFPSAHPYSHAVGGGAASLSALTLEDAKAFAKKHYGPSVATLVVSAPEGVTAMKGLVQKLSVARLTTGGARHVPVTASNGVGEPHGEAITLHDAPVASPTLWVGWSVPGGLGANDDVLRLLGRIASFEISGDVVGRDGDIGRALSGSYSGLQGGMLWLELGLKSGSDPSGSARSASRQMLHGMSERIHDSSWFEALKRHVATSYRYSEEDTASRTLNLAQSAAFRADPTFRRGQPERIVALEASTVSEFYQRYLSEARARAVFVRPAREGAAVDVDGSSAVHAVNGAPPPPASTSRSWIRNLGLDRAEITELKNGMDLVVIEKPGSPFHTVALGFRGGVVADAPPGARLAALWARNSVGLPPTVWGVAYSNNSTEDGMNEVLRSTGTDLSFTLKQLDDMSAFPVSWPTRYFTGQLEVLRSEEASPQGVWERRLEKAVFGDHVYGAAPTADEMRDISATRVYHFVDAVRRPDNAALVIVGEIPPDLNTLVDRTLGRWRLPASSEPSAVVAPPPIAGLAGGERLLVQNQPGTSLSRLEYRCALPPITEEKYATALLLDAVVELLLYTELRERLGAAYSVRHRVNVLRGGTALLEVGTEVDYAGLTRALAALNQLGTRSFASVVDATTLDRARAYLARGFNGSYATSHQLALGVLDYWTRGWSPRGLDALADRIYSTSADDVVRLAQHCQKNWLIAALGDEARIRDAWAHAE